MIFHDSDLDRNQIWSGYWRKKEVKSSAITILTTENILNEKDKEFVWTCDFLLFFILIQYRSNSLDDVFIQIHTTGNSK